MTALEQLILEAVRELERAVAAMPAAEPKPDLRPMFARIDELSSQLPAGTSPDLLHYLQRKSYQKVRLWLEGIDPEKGTCRS